MKKLILSAFALLLLLAAIHPNIFAQQKAGKETKEDDDSWSGGFSRRAPGTWDAVVEGEQIHIQLNGPDWNSGRNVPSAELGTLPTDKIGEFVLNREAGKISFKGVFEGRFGHGNYQFEENAQFKAYLEQRGYKGLDKELMIHILLTDINKGYFDFMKANGYVTISNDKLRDLAEQDLQRKIY